MPDFLAGKLERGLTQQEEYDLKELRSMIFDKRGGEIDTPLLNVMRAFRKEIDKKKDDPQLSRLLRAMIRKQASDEEVSRAAAAIEEYVAENEAARRQIGRIANTIVSSGKISNYGTEAAQEVIRDWAKKYPRPDTPRRE